MPEMPKRLFALAAAGGVSVFASGVVVGWVLFSTPAKRPVAWPPPPGPIPPLPATLVSAAAAGEGQRTFDLGDGDPLFKLEAMLRHDDGYRALELFYGLIREADGQTLPALFDRLVDEPDDGPLKDTYLTLLTERWARVDPRGMASDLSARGGGQRIRDAAGRGYAVWSEAEPDAALAAALALEPGSLRRTCLEQILAARAQTDPPAALQLLAGLPEGAVDATRVRIYAFEGWARLDAGAAAEAAGAVAHAEARWDALAAVAAGWFATEPSGAATWAVGLPPGEQRERILRSGFARWFEVDPDAAAAALARLLPGTADPGVLSNAARALVAARGIDIALQWVGSAIQSPPARDAALAAVVSSVAYRDPPAAARLAESIGGGRDRDRLLATIAGHWAAADTAAALRWVESLPGGDGRDGAFAAAFKAWAGIDPGSAARSLGMIPGEARLDAAKEVGRAWAHSDPVAALREADGIDDDEARNVLLDATLRIWLRGDPNAARSFVEATDDTDLQGRWLAVATAAWTRVDPAAAVAHALERFDEETLEQFARTAIRQAAYNDLAVATELISNTPPGDLKDRAIEDAMFLARERDPALALRWAEEMTGRKRSILVSIAISNLARSDRAAALEALERSALPEEERARLRTRITGD